MIRTGLGYDVHKLIKGDSLIVGSVAIPSNFKSVGHSDGDCLIHAIVDAMLGAANLGDIGCFFPSSDSKWKGSPSSIFLEKAVSILPDDATLNDHLGDAYWKANRKEEALSQWRRVLILDPDFKEKSIINKKIKNGL